MKWYFGLENTMRIINVWDYNATRKQPVKHELHELLCYSYNDFVNWSFLAIFLLPFKILKYLHILYVAVIFFLRD